MVDYKASIKKVLKGSPEGLYASQIAARASKGHRDAFDPILSLVWEMEATGELRIDNHKRFTLC